MIKYSGFHICSKCGTECQWIYSIPEQMGTYNYSVENTPLEMHCVKRVSRSDEPPYKFLIRCHSCDNEDLFIYTPAPHNT